jgi:sirohydrochlorin cobaltochelatase
MLVAGEHAVNDMAGDQEDSWKSILERSGCRVEVSLQGLGELSQIRALYGKRLSAAREALG